MTLRHAMRMGALVLGAPILLVSACAPSAPDKGGTPSLPTTVVTTPARTPPSGTSASASSVTPSTATPSLAATSSAAPDPAWEALDQAQRGCADGPASPVSIAGIKGADLVAVNDCAGLLNGVDPASNTVIAVGSRTGVNVFQSIPASLWSAQVVPVPDGFWLAGSLLPDQQAGLWLMRRDGPVKVSLPSGLLGFDAIAVDGSRLLAAAEIGEPGVMIPANDSVLLSVTPDGTVTTLKTFPQTGIEAIATDGTHILLGLRGSGTVTVAAYSGKDWTETRLGPGAQLGGVAVSGDTFVVTYNEQSQGEAAAVDTAVSRDGGATWTQTRVEGGYGTGLWARPDGTVAGQLFLPDSPGSVLYTLTSAGGWKPLAGGPSGGSEQPSVSLARCGFWSSDPGSGTLAYTPLPGACPT